MEENKQTDLEALQKYLGLETIDDAKKAKWILDELKVYGSWGDKVASYFSSILSGSGGYKSLLSEKQVELYKTLFK